MVLVLPQVAGLQQRLLIAPSLAAEPSGTTPGEGRGRLHLGTTGGWSGGEMVGKCWGKVKYHVMIDDDWIRKNWRIRKFPLFGSFWVAIRCLKIL